MAEKEVYKVASRLFVPYQNMVGTLAGRFFRELRDHRRLLGIKCTDCDKVYMPPRSLCPTCFSQLEKWVELPSAGTLMTYTLVGYTYSSYYQPKEAPYLIGIIQLDGAHTGLVHLLGEMKPEEVKIGIRVQAVFRESREGNILDIAYFKPLSG
jgi:uncharacterized OB-fold protein